MSAKAPDAGTAYPIPGYIFVGENGAPIPHAYRAKWHDEWGFFARITRNHFSGHYPVPYADYLRAADAYADYIEKTDAVRELSKLEQAIQGEFLTQLEVDPSHSSIPTVIEAACRATRRRMLAYARYEIANNAWQEASRDVQTNEELHAREQAYADALDARIIMDRAVPGADAMRMH